MASEFERLSAALAARMQELGCAPTDPRLAPMLAQVQALMREHFTGPQAGANVVAMPLGAQRAAPAAPAGAPDVEVSSDLPADLARLLKAYLATCPFGGFTQAPALSQSDEGRRILDLAPADRTKMAVHAYAALTGIPYGGADGSGLRRVVSDLLRAKLTLEDAQAIAFVKAAIRDGFLYTGYSPNQAVLGTLERHVRTHGLSPDLRGAIEGLLARMKHGFAGGNAQGRKLLNGVEALLAHQPDDAAAVPTFKPKPDAWGRALSAKLEALPADDRARLMALLALAAKGGAGAKPAKGWLKRAGQAVDQPDQAGLAELLFAAIECDDETFHIAPDNQDTVRGLIWLAALAAPEVAVPRLEAFARTCLTFSSAHFGYRSLVLGNASIHAFSLVPGMAGVGSLSRLRRRLTRPGEIKTVDKALAALAEARGVTPGELEEIGLPDYGFARDGTLAIAVGPAMAVLTINEADALDVTWRGAGGQPLKGPPNEVKESHADALKLFKAQVKEIGDTLKAQRMRLERLYLDEREWTLDDWRARYRDAPLVARMARRLIWSFKLGERWVAGLPQGDDVCDGAGARLDLAGPGICVRLWHPMQSDANHVLAWRQRLASLEITQPFKQAHREIYVLTDAERETHDYSNRFAGHVVQQRQFRALCQARGWSCPAFGGWDRPAEEARQRAAGRVLGRADRGRAGRPRLPIPLPLHRSGALRRRRRRADRPGAGAAGALLRADARRRPVRRHRQHRQRSDLGRPRRRRLPRLLEPGRVRSAVGSGEDAARRAAGPAAGAQDRQAVPAGRAISRRRGQAQDLSHPSRLRQHPDGAEQPVSVHRARRPEPGRPRPPAVRRRRDAGARPLEGVPAGRRRQDQGRLDPVADPPRDAGSIERDRHRVVPPLPKLRLPRRHREARRTAACAAASA